LARLRALQRRAVQQESAVDDAAALLDTLRAAAPATGPAAPVLTAYEGAIRLLRAKHGSWPLARLRHVQAGLRLLDRAVADAPDDLEVRWLRLVNGYHLPGIFGRGDTVREDFAAVAALLPERAWHHDPHVVSEIAEFLHAHGDLDAETRAALATWRGDDV
jgi:hypothetical protein